MHDQKDPYGNQWINPPAAPAAAGGTHADKPRTDQGFLDADDYHDTRRATMPPADTAPAPAPAVEMGALDAGGRWVPAQPELPGMPPPRWTRRDEHSQNTELSTFGMCWAWLGLDSRDGRMLAGDGGPLTSGAIKFGEVREVQVRPQRPFKARYLWVHSSCASSFLIHSVRVGNRVAGVAPQPIPAEMFAVDYGELAKLTIHDVEPGRVISVEVHQVPASMPRGPLGWRGIPFDLPAAQVSVDVGIIVENIERTKFEPIRFLGAFLGEAPR